MSTKSFENRESDEGFEFAADDRTVLGRQMALVVTDSTSDGTVEKSGVNTHDRLSGEEASANTDAAAKRHRRTGVYEISNEQENQSENAQEEDQQRRGLQQTLFSRIGIELTKNENPENDCENRLVVPPPVSGYCSSAASAGSEDESEKSNFRKNFRCGSSDSAIAQSDDENGALRSNWGEKREEIDDTPYAFPVFSPYSPRRSVDHENVPSKTLIEARCLPFPVTDRKFSDSFSEISDVFDGDSRRQSCFTDDGDEISRYRYWRTPSVVVSDYSDDPVGLSLEDIEYIRNQHKDGGGAGSSPDSSLHSSCSNLNLFNSNPETFRKVSDCSTCSFSGDEDDYSRENRLRPDRNSSRSPSPSGAPDGSPRTRRRGSPGSRRGSTCSGYEQYQRSLLEVPTILDYGDASSDDLSSEWDSDVPEVPKKPSPWRKIRNFVQWTPFFQTYKKQRYPWVQLAGHQGNFKAGPDQGTILKKLCLKEEKCFKVLMDDVLRPFVPEYKGLITSDDGECSFIQLQDLLSDFISPCVMDCKIGVRTYLEEELAKAKEKPKLRKDMYEKMCQIDNAAPTDEEHKMKGVTKPRYMVWRETISSTATLGFRIEGIRKADGTSSKDFKTVKSKDQVMKEFIEFTENFPHAVPKYIQRLKSIKDTLESSPFFQSHEVIGSSLLFVHDRYNANVWLIDFAKTLKLPEDVAITHKDKWKVGNHEDGYMIGLDNLIAIFKSILEIYPVPVSPPLSLPDTPEIELSERCRENT